MPNPGIYRHYKGNLYRLLFIARHSETLEDMAIYQDVRSPEKIWARPLSMWEETVQANGKTLRRFKYLGPKEEG